MGKKFRINEVRYEPNEICSVWVDDCDFDEDLYFEFISDNNIKDSKETRLNYAKENCEFTIEYTDAETDHHMGWEDMMYDDMVYNFGEKLANDLFMSWFLGENERFELLSYTDSNVDTNDIKSIEKDAILKLQHGEYFKGARGFILTNGVMVYTEAEHSMISRVEGVGDKFDAVNMGWVRVLPNSIDVGQKPTDEQRLVIAQIVDCYSDDILYLDVFKDGEHSMVYNNPNPRRVLNDINRFFGGGLNESEEAQTQWTDVEAVNDVVKKHFGTTGYYPYCGYLLTDGSMLNFCQSGRGFRDTDHRDINDIDGLDMETFIALGNIRMAPEIGGVCMIKEPNEKQYRSLPFYFKYFFKKLGDVTVEIVDDNINTIDWYEYALEDGWNGFTVTEDIKAYFNNGKKLGNGKNYEEEYDNNDIRNFLQENMKKKNVLNESFVLKNGIFKKKDGGQVNIVYIDPASSESTFEFKNVIKDKFGAKWLGQMHTWGWFVGKDAEEVYRKQIQPCLNYLNSVQKQGEPSAENDIIAVIDGLIEQLKNEPETIDVANDFGSVNDKAANRKELLDKVIGFKKELMTCVNSEEFKKKMELLINISKAHGHRLSLFNTILVMLQDPEATFVKSRGFWLKANRRVVNGAIPISLLGGQGMAKYSKEQKDEITKNFLKAMNVNDKSELNIGDREKLDIALRGHGNARFFGYVAYDIRFTEVIPGKEDLIPNMDVELPWYTEGEETDETKKYIGILEDIISDHGISFSASDKLGRSRGVSKGGEIQVRSDIKKDVGMLNTLIHEFSHELLHQKYLKSNNPAVAELFQGTESGRELVEQQAELCAWIVMKYLGFDMETNLNYVMGWGLDEKNASEVFDSIAEVANYIYKNIEERNGNAMNESVLKGINITGKEIADVVGLGSLYDKSKEMEDENEISTIKESFYRLFNKIQL